MVQESGRRSGRVMAFVVRHKLALSLIVAACCGALIAVGARPAMQAPVESGQVLAGLVSYPADNPFYVYHVKLWTVLNQGAAVMLKAGMSEVSASLWIEGVTGALSFAALFLITYAVSGRAVVSLLMPLFLLYFDYVGIIIAYPVFLLGTTHTYGIFGLSWVIFVVGALGVGWYRTGALLAGLAIAVHPSLGAFSVAVAAITGFLHRKELGPHLKPIAGYFLAGAAVTVASFFVQQHFAAHVTGTDPAGRREYLEAFIRNFDYHRSFSGWEHRGLILGLLTSAFSVVVVRRQRPLPGASIVFTATAVSIGVTMLAAFFVEFVPALEPLKVLMPWRYINFANLCLFPLAAGYLAAEFPTLPRLRSVLLPMLLAAGALWRFSNLPDIDLLYFVIVLSALAAALLPWGDLPERLFGAMPRWRDRIVAAVAVVLILRMVPTSALSLERMNLQVPEIYRYASTRPGVLLTAGDMHLVQLLTRRPVLLDGGGLDMFPMIPETGPRFNAILKGVYGLDLFIAPPEDERNKAIIPLSHKGLWERRTSEEWAAIRKEFGVTDILTPVDWELRLPLIASDGNVNLFTIP